MQKTPAEVAFLAAKGDDATHAATLTECILTPRADDDEYSLTGIARRIMGKMAARRRIGPFDWSPGSYDWRVATARAWRIVCRDHGERISMRDAMREA